MRIGKVEIAKFYHLSFCRAIKMGTSKAQLIILGLFMLLFGCSDSSEQIEEGNLPQPGNLYWLISEEGNYKVLKVLVVEADVIHLCYYNNVFKEQPGKDVIPSLYFGTHALGSTLLDRAGEKTTHGRKHMAIIKKIWTNWNPQYLDSSKITPDELNSYEDWNNGDRYVFAVDLHPPSD